MHGHELIIKNKELFKNLKGKSLLEIGTERGCGSTILLAEMAEEIGMDFITVDVDEEQTKNVIKPLNKINSAFKTITEYGEIFLKNFKGEIGLIYLDAFDFWHDNHSQERIDAYKKRGTEITNENCWKMHYNCAVELVKLMKEGTYICFDDVLSKEPEWEGKGKLAIPYLLNNGFNIKIYEPNCIILERCIKK
ncbi:hypothetical protein GF336_01940 [Candidatus Woesearchaeota archaeon]|nr:hypothetical protein [Candidatus Woesearchaeota archaeon]